MNAGDDPYAIASQIIKASIQSMEDLLCVLDREQFNGTVEALLGARRIGFYGVGDAKIVAESAYHKFNRMGAVCDTSNEPGCAAGAGQPARRRRRVRAGQSFGAFAHDCGDCAARQRDGRDGSEHNQLSVFAAGAHVRTMC